MNQAGNDVVPGIQDQNVAPIFIHGLQINGDHRSDKEMISNILRDAFFPELLGLEPVVEVQRRTKIEGEKIARIFEVRLALWHDRSLILRKSYQLKHYLATRNVFITEDNRSPIALAPKKRSENRNGSTVLVKNTEAASSNQSSGKRGVHFVYGSNQVNNKVLQQAKGAVSVSKPLAEPKQRSIDRKNPREPNQG